MSNEYNKNGHEFYCYSKLMFMSIYYIKVTFFKVINVLKIKLIELPFVYILLSTSIYNNNFHITQLLIINE